MFMSVHRLAKILEKRGAAAALAKAWGKPQSIVSDLCSGKTRINEDHIKEISQILKIPPWHLFIDPNEIYPQKHRKIVAAYMGLPENRRESIDILLFSDNKDIPLEFQTGQAGYTLHEPDRDVGDSFKLPEDLK